MHGKNTTFQKIGITTYYYQHTRKVVVLTLLDKKEPAMYMGGILYDIYLLRIWAKIFMLGGSLQMYLHILNM